MASPPQISRGVNLPRVPKFETPEDARRWSVDLLRALESRMGGGSGSSTLGADRFSAGPLIQGVNLVQPTAYPYTPLVSDLIVLVDTTAARVINLPSATLGFTTSIKDFSGTAGANNITINASAGEFIDGGASYVMATNYQSIMLYATDITGSEWVVF